MVEQPEKTMEELRELAISFIEDGAYYSAKDCIVELIKRKAGKKKPCEDCDHLKFEKETNALYCELKKDYCEAEE